MGIFRAISQKIVQAADQSGRRQARQQLLRMSNRQLDDFGISRHKLLEGTSAWPWATESEDYEVAEAVIKPAPKVTNVAMEVSDVAPEQRRVA